jgi:hypothetical protein
MKVPKKKRPPFGEREVFQHLMSDLGPRKIRASARSHVLPDASAARIARTSCRVPSTSAPG